jgi:hypothetical protein
VRYVVVLATLLSATVAVASPLGLRIGMTKEQVLKAKPCATKPGPKRLACSDAKFAGHTWEATLRLEPKLRRIELASALGADRAAAEAAFGTLVATLEKTYGKTSVKGLFDQLDADWDNRSGEEGYVGRPFKFKQGLEGMLRLADDGYTVTLVAK